MHVLEASWDEVYCFLTCGSISDRAGHFQSRPLTKHRTLISKIAPVDGGMRLTFLRPVSDKIRRHILGFFLLGAISFWLRGAKVLCLKRMYFLAPQSTDQVVGGPHSFLITRFHLHTDRTQRCEELPEQTGWRPPWQLLIGSEVGQEFPARAQARGLDSVASHM